MTHAQTNQPSLEEILARVASGDEQALALLYDRTSKRTFAIACMILGSRETAEEAVLTGYTRIWKKATLFDARLGSARVWVDTIIRRCACDRLRSENRKPACFDLDDCHPTGENQEYDLVQRERARVVADLLDTLPEEQQIVIRAAYFEGASHSRISQELDLPLGTVKTRIRNGMEALRRSMKQFKGALL